MKETLKLHIYYTATYYNCTLNDFDKTAKTEFMKFYIFLLPLLKLSINFKMLKHHLSYNNDLIEGQVIT